MRKKRTWLIIILTLVIAYLMGPKPETPVYLSILDRLPAGGDSLEKFIAAREAQHPIKPDNQARIIWQNDSLKNKTPFSIVYLHGFSASQEEGDPVHRDIAKKFGCNLYLSRLAGHGLDTPEVLKNFTAEAYWESAKDALNVGKQLGDKVILMGTSTGGSNALQLAAAYPNDVAALVLLSPNIAINDANAWLLNNPWGLQIAKLVMGSSYMKSHDQRDIYKKYWYSHYRLEGAVALEEMLETSMTEQTFQKVKQPVLMLYYYKDDIHQDSVVKVSAMLKMFDQLGTPADQKFRMAMPNTGDHVIGSYIKSKDVEGVEKEIEKFLSRIIH